MIAEIALRYVPGHVSCPPNFFIVSTMTLSAEDRATTAKDGANRARRGLGRVS
jgi:hypothetical protein